MKTQKNSSLKIIKKGVYFSLYEWYYTKNNQEKVSYDVFSYWSEKDGLNNLFAKFDVKEINIGESFFFEFDSKSEFGFERSLTDDFKTQYFKITNRTNEFISESNQIEYYLLFDLEPVYK